MSIIKNKCYKNNRNISINKMIKKVFILICGKTGQTDHPIPVFAD